MTLFGRELNWTWIKARLRSRCRHEWMSGDTEGHLACRRCGVWRWWPVKEAS